MKGVLVKEYKVYRVKIKENSRICGEFIIAAPTRQMAHDEGTLWARQHLIYPNNDNVLVETWRVIKDREPAIIFVST